MNLTTDKHNMEQNKLETREGLIQQQLLSSWIGGQATVP